MIAIITQQERDILVGQTFDGTCFFNPIEDMNLNFVISEQEYYYCLGLWYLDELNSELVFIKDLSLTIYEPKISENPFI